MTLRDLLILEEGIRLNVYDDATGEPLKQGKKLVGNPTIGIGRNLSGRGLERFEVMFLLENDCTRVGVECGGAFPWFAKLSPIRQIVIQDMCFNLGLSALKRFTATLAAIKCGDYVTAATQMLKSKWATQVGKRAKRLAFMMANNRYPTEKELEQW